MAVLRMVRRWSSAPDLPDVSMFASDRHATLHGVVFDILVGSQSRVSPDMTADDLGHSLCYHLLGSGRAGFASRKRLDRSSVLETGLTRARHQPAIGATKSTRLVGLRRSLARDAPDERVWLLSLLSLVDFEVRRVAV